MIQLRRRWGAALGLLVLALLLGALPPSQAEAQSKLYFPQTGHFLGGAFRSFWERRGGVAIFGYPITEEFYQSRDGRVAQYFERARFELDVRGNVAVVSLGLIGREYLSSRGLGFPRVANPNQRGVRYFPETGHTLRGAFRSFWESRGGLEIFGFPLSEEETQQLEDGRNYTVQYFERARFELVGSQVRLGLLGSALAPCQLRPGLPVTAPPSGPVAEGDPKSCAPPPPTYLPSRAYPEVSAPGTTLGFEVRGYQPNETVSLWINLPGGGARALPYQGVAASDGVLLIGFRTLTSDPPGQYSIVGQGTRSGRVAVAIFRLQR